MADSGITLTGYSHRERATHNGGFCSTSKCSTVTFAVVTAVAFVFVILGSIHLFGGVGSVGFIAALAAGGGVAALMMGALICSALSYCKKQNEDEPVPLPRPRETTTNTPLKGNSAESRKAKKKAAVEQKTPLLPITHEIRHSTESSKIEEKEVGKNSAPPPYDAVCQRALDFARAKLKECSYIIPRFVSMQPVNPEILPLMALYEEYDQSLIQTFSEHVNSSTQQEIVELMGACVKIGYAVGCLMLEDLPEFTKQAKKFGCTTYGDVIANQDLYAITAFYFLPDRYHAARSEPIYEETDDDEEVKASSDLSNAKLFYEEGTPQSEWRILYNDFCRRSRYWVSEKDFKAPDQAKITQLDNDINFKPIIF